tara:strand:- start:3355 stop:3540 length:186 start_codon:yes stop_codon:yes gene_type:complete
MFAFTIVQVFPFSLPLNQLWVEKRFLDGTGTTMILLRPAERGFADSPLEECLGRLEFTDKK